MLIYFEEWDNGFEATKTRKAIEKVEKRMESKFNRRDESNLDGYQFKLEFK